MRSFTSWIVVDGYWVWEMSNLLLRSPNHCLVYHCIISDMTFPSLHWYGLIIIHFAFFMSFYVFLTVSFLILIDSTSYSFLTLIHVSDSIPSSHYSPTLLIVWPLLIFLLLLSTFPLVTFRSIAHEIFSCITSYTQGYGFDHWVFESSIPSFLSPYHLSLRYILFLKTTLRPWD